MQQWPSVIPKFSANSNFDYTCTHIRKIWTFSTEWSGDCWAVRQSNCMARSGCGWKLSCPLKNNADFIDVISRWLRLSLTAVPFLHMHTTRYWRTIVPTFLLKDVHRTSTFIEHQLNWSWSMDKKETKYHTTGLPSDLWPDWFLYLEWHEPKSDTIGIDCFIYLFLRGNRFATIQHVLQ